MKLQERISALSALGAYMASGDEAWKAVLRSASIQNPWFIEPFVNTAVEGIRKRFLDAESLTSWARGYPIPDHPDTPRVVGLVLAGNIPLVGFHDILCTFISGHRQRVKLSSRDEILPTALVRWLHTHYPQTQELICIDERLNGCDAYIATGSDNTARYFDYYFSKYPHVIRKNRTSVAILDGTESPEELEKLSDDIQLYFGLGCRNVSQVLVPEGYDFVPLLQALKKYAFLADEHKYRHNFDYHLTLQIMNNRFYMTNDSILLTEETSPFSPIGQLHYRHYAEGSDPAAGLAPEKIQCVVGHGHVPFGQAQLPGLSDYADGVDTMQFLLSL
ncbi:MAG: acyl-CoA reductase [Chitinophagaceae bacterium]|nr:acyl-CoA reductase [Chitinophagaceae bacterium]